MDWNKRQGLILERSSFVEVGLLAVRDVQAALDYEKRLKEFKKRNVVENTAAASRGPVR